MKGRPSDSDEDPRAYANVFVRLGSPPPSRGRFEKLVAELRRRAVVLGERLRIESVALASRVRARGGAARRRGREERASLLERGREWRGALGRRADETRVVLVGRIRQASGAFVRQVREERVIIMRGVGEVCAALRQAIREQRTVLAARFREGKAAVGHRMHEWATRPRWRFEWHRSGPPALPRQPSVFVAIASFAFAVGVAWWTGGPTDDVPQRRASLVPEASAPAPMGVPIRNDSKPAVLDVGQVLRTPGVSEAAQLAVIDELMKDPSDVATNALLAGVDAESLHVSMACLRALAGRSCDAVAAALANRLDDPTWQRRAWAARVLGSNECARAGRHLNQRLAVEADQRVQAQLKIAINSLKEPGA
jgi:hypothetical protein